MHWSRKPDRIELEGVRNGCVSNYLSSDLLKIDTTNHWREFIIFPHEAFDKGDKVKTWL